MSADSPSPTQPDAQGSRAALIQWLVIGVAGVGFVFVASAHLPDGIKLPGVLTVGLGAAAGWGWGRFGRSLRIAPNGVVAIIVWCAIAGAEVLGAWKNHHDRAEYLREKWQALLNGPVAQGQRDALAQEPENESAEDREKRLKQLADLERADAPRWQRLEFHGYLSSRMERLKIRALLPYPRPELVWAAEVILGSTLGAWLTMSALRPPGP